MRPTLISFGRFTRFCLLLIISLSALSYSAISQNKDSKGKDFWLMFNGNISSPKLTIFIASDVNTSGTVAIPGLGFTVPFTVTANTITPVEVPVVAATHSSDVVDDKGIHVTALQEVTAYGLNYAPFTTDAYLGLPTDVLGTDYIIMSYGGFSNFSEFGIVATQNATTVTITPSITTGVHPAGTPYTINLNQGQTYELSGGSDFTGTIITANKVIGVMGANACANVPPNASYCDHINEMLPPTTAWGKKFGTVPLKARIKGDTWRFLASENNTTVRINGVAQPPINRGKWVETTLTAQSIIESDKPILAAQFSQGSSLSGNPGDPFMMLIPPLEQFLPKYTVTTVSGYVSHYINVIAPASIIGSLTLDGTAIAAAEFTPIGTTGFSGAQLTVKQGIHNLIGSLPFGVFMYGFNNDDSYGYPGGQSFAPIAIVKTITLTPATGSANIGNSQCFDATVKDQFGNPLDGVRVDFAITGTHPGSSGFAFTNASGIAHFCYTGTVPGADKIVASIGTLSATANFTWTKVSEVYYSKPTGDLHNLLTWGVNPDGSGANPTSFGTGKTFNLANRSVNYMMTGDWTVAGLIVNPAGSRLVINGFVLTESGISGAGTISGSTASELVIKGAVGGGVINFTSGANSLKNLSLNTSASATLGTPLNLYGMLNVHSGTLNTANQLTLKSTATTTAIVAPVMGTITGSSIVERYIPARRAWRLINAPVTGSQTINAAWQEGVTTASPNPNPNPGYGTHITGGSTYGSVANGFDQHAGSNSSLLVYNNPTDSWKPIPNTNATTVGNKPYMLFVRGNRGLVLDGPTLPPNNTVLRAKGTLLVGNQMYSVAASGFTAIPNPYQSPINFATITKTNVQNSFYVWDPKLGGTYGVGGYVTVSWNGTSYDVTPAPASPESQYIQPWQSFLVKSTGTAGSVTIKESDKVSTPINNVYRTEVKSSDGILGNISANEGLLDAGSIQGLRINLQVVNDDHTTSLVDEVLTNYSRNYSSQVDQMDAEKMMNVGENLSLVRNGHLLAIERRSEVNTDDTIYLQLTNTTQQQYLFRIMPVDLSPARYTAFLEDNYLHTATPVSLNSITQISFTINSDMASQGKDRFRVILSTNKAMVSSFASGQAQFLTYPNPLAGNTFQLQMINQPKGTYKVTVINSLGQVVHNSQVEHAGGSATKTIQVLGKLAQGLYQVRVMGKESKANLKVSVIE